MAGPSAALVDRLTAGASLLTDVVWHERVESTNALAADAAAGGAAQGYAVLADVQTRGRGRRGRSWTAPPETSLLLSVVLRPAVEPRALPLLGLVAGVAVADAVDLVAQVAAMLKWPNDVLADGKKVAGLLLEGGPSGCVLGVGVNVDWRAVRRGSELLGATSLAEVSGRDVDRWQLLEALAETLGDRYRAWTAAPRAFLRDYRRRCSTLGQYVRVDRPGADTLVGVAVDVADDGALVLRDDAGRRHICRAGEVHHVRPADLLS